MIPFDPKAYEETVVKPLRRWSGRELPDDLVSRYAIDLGMSDIEVARRLVEVRSKWNKGTGQAGFAQKIYRAFLRADEDLRRKHGDQLSTIHWWKDYAESRVGARQDQIDELAKTLRANFGDLGLIAPGQLDATVRATYVALSPDEVDEALAKAGVRRSTPVELPKVSGLLDTIYRQLRSHLVDAETASVVELLYGEVGPFRLLDSFGGVTPVAEGLTAEAVRHAVDRENKRSNNQAARQALGILASAVKDGVDLRKLTLFHLLDDVRQHHGHGVPASALLKRLLQAKLNPDEARLAVFSVLNESARTGAGGLASIKELVEEGRLIAAQQALGTIAGTEDAVAATALVERQLVKVRELRDTARESLRRGAEADALHRLRQAMALAVDDEDVRAEIRRIPPEPVLEVSAREEGVGVRVSWRASASHAEGTRYRLVRGEGRIPADADDGVVVAVEDGRTVAADPKVPAGTLVGYAVFASTEDGPWSRPSGVTIEALPRVHDVRLTFEGGVVEGRWKIHPEALGVDVRREDGVVLTTSGRTMFRDRTAPEGSEQVYTLVAQYRRGDGTEAVSAPVRARTATKGRLQPVRALSLSAVPGEPGPQVAISWKQQEDTEVVVRRASGQCRWEFGEVVPVTDLADYGEEVVGRRDERDGWQVLTADVPTGRFHYVPFTIAPSGAIRGHDGALGIALPVIGLRHQRFADELLLAWEWPEQAGMAEVRWTTERESGRERLTRQQYRAGGGCRIHCGPGRVQVRVHTVVLAEGGECASADVELIVPERPPTVSYTVDMARKPLVGGGSVRVRLTADQVVPRCTVLVVAAQGAVMPRRPTDGRVLLRGERALRPDDEVELTAELPRMKRPYWVRCFLESDAVRLIDPPTKQLKVS